MGHPRKATPSSPVDTSAVTGAGVSTAEDKQEVAGQVQADLVAEVAQKAEVVADPVAEVAAGQVQADLVAEAPAGAVLLITNNTPSDLTLGRKFLPAHQEVEVSFSDEKEFNDMAQQAKAVGDLNGWTDVLTVKEKA